MSNDVIRIDNGILTEVVKRIVEIERWVTWLKVSDLVDERDTLHVLECGHVRVARGDRGISEANCFLCGGLHPIVSRLTRPDTKIAPQPSEATADNSFQPGDRCCVFTGGAPCVKPGTIEKRDGDRWLVQLDRAGKIRVTEDEMLWMPEGWV